MEKPRVYSVMPSRPLSADLRAAYSHAYLATKGGCEIIPGFSQSPFIGKGFNMPWALAVQYANAGAITHFLLHHDDLEIKTHGWLDVMLEEMRRTGAAVLSVVVPLKDDTSLTSTAIEMDDQWNPRKLALKGCWALPETFCASDTGCPLLVNTGLMLVDLTRPEFRQVKDGELVFYFTINDRVVVRSDGSFEAQCKPEDWNFSRLCHAHRLPVYATRKIHVVHHGGGEWSNQPPKVVQNGEIQGWFDFADLYRRAVANAPEGGTLVEVGVWKGKSLSFLLSEAKRAAKGLRVFGVDHFEGSPGEASLTCWGLTPDQLADECMRNCETADYPWQLLRMPSVEAAEYFEDGSVAFCFIDANHDRAREDILVWLPKVKPGGILAGHDYDAATDPAVVMAVDELLPNADKVGRCWVMEVVSNRCREVAHA